MKTRDVPTYIYSLSDPRTGDVRYIGAAVDPETRLDHLRRADHRMAQRLREWITRLSAVGTAPVMTVLREVPAGHDWRDAERETIHSHRSAGCDLLNTQHAVTPKRRVVWAILAEATA